MARRRQWNRMTDAVRLVLSTGLVQDVTARDRVEPVSMLIAGDPGTGKTALLQKFVKLNPTLAYRDDLTWMGLVDLLQQAKHHSVTHILFPEFQKLMQRKGETWENTVGLLGQAIEDGVQELQVGKRRVRLGGVRIGVVAAMTGDSFDEVRDYFESKGMMSRLIFTKWQTTPTEAALIYKRMRSGDKRDLVQVRLPKVARPPVRIRINNSLGIRVENFVHQILRADPRDKRPVVQFRQLVCAAALIRGGQGIRTATLADLKRVQEFEDVWKGSIRP